MWRCPECHEQLEDQFDSCWRCAGNGEINTAYRHDSPSGKKRKNFLLWGVAMALVIFFAAPHTCNFFTHTIYRSASPGVGGTVYFVRQSDAFTTVFDLYVRDTRCPFCTMTKVTTLWGSPIDEYPQEAIWSGDGSVVAVKSEHGRWQYAYDFRLHKSYRLQDDASPAISALLHSRGGEGKGIFVDTESYKRLSRPLYPWELVALEE